MISVYALQNEKVVSILDVIAGRAQVSSGFQCPRCAAELLPVMGQIRRPHFRHRILDAGRGETCTPEGVVHSAAKAIIAARVAEAVAVGNSYTLLLAAEIACPERMRVLSGRCRHRTARSAIDLARLGVPTVEASRGEFRYDLLFEPEGLPPLALEIAVTAPVAREKWQAGIPLVEIQVRSEDDLAHLVSGIEADRLSARALHVDPFVGAPLVACAREACASRCLSFSVMRSGRVDLEEVAPFEAGRLRVARAHHVVAASDQAFAISRFEALDRLTRQAYFEAGAPVRSCLVCRHHDLSDPATDAEGPVICTLDRKASSVNRGASCAYFTPFSNIEEVRELRLHRKSGAVIE